MSMKPKKFLCYTIFAFLYWFFLQVFGKYDKHRKLVLDDFHHSSYELRTFCLGKNENIQMVLQLIQCVVELPVIEVEPETEV